MACKFNKQRASTILAEADLYGDSKILARWGVARQTLHNYRKRLSSDEELVQLFTLKKRMLLVDWQTDATRCLKTGLGRLTEIIPNATKEDADTIHAIAGACKIVGELKISYEALSEPTPDQQSQFAEATQTTA